MKIEKEIKLYSGNIFKKKSKKAIQEAIELLQKADQTLAAVPASDEVARTQIEIRSSVRFLNKEIGDS
jgi:RNase P/RNase MRP subunit p30